MPNVEAGFCETGVIENHFQAKSCFDEGLDIFRVFKQHDPK